MIGINPHNRAALCRLYRGIHYRPVIEVGIEQSEKVGNFIVS